MRHIRFILIVLLLIISNNKLFSQENKSEISEIAIYQEALEHLLNKNYTDALELLIPAANSGLANAQNLLAICYTHGYGVDFNETEAIRLYEMSAKQGFAPAQYNLGVIYATGNIGGYYYSGKNIEAAIQLFEKSAKQGHEKAIERIEEIKSYEAITKKYNIIRSGSVDLGLSVNWASCNLGGKRPEDYGDYYAWGETETKNDYTWKTYKFIAIQSLDTSPYLTKYNYVKDGKIYLDLDDDAAYINLGETWRIPSIEEFKELKDQCKWTFIEYYWTEGYIVTGTNGKSIFLEAENIFLSPEVCAWYATNSIDKDEPQYANTMALDYFNTNFMLIDRSRSFVIRPVCD